MIEPTEEERQALAEGKVLLAIYYLRRRTGFGLAEAKNTVDSWRDKGVV